MLPVRPKINYAMLGQAVEEYTRRGYIYVECPWTVDEASISATIPNINRSFRLGVGSHDASIPTWSDGPTYLVGSAEQSFLSLDLAPGPYVGVTPCFRWEYHEDIFTRYMFMKVELFVTSEDATLSHVMDDAYEVMSLLGNTNKITVVNTEEGHDFNLFGIEVGSFGERTTPNLSWIYGTGLALPRFSVALAFRDIG